MLFSRLAALGLAAPALAAYVQWQPCRGADSARMIGTVPPESFRAGVSVQDTGNSSLEFRVITTVDDEDCTLGHDISNLRVDFEMLGGGSVEHVKPKATCVPSSWAPGRSSLQVSGVANIGFLHALSTFYVAIHFDSQGAEAGCLSAEITPVPAGSITSALRYGPLALFIFVLLVAILRTLYDAPVALPTEDDDSSVSTTHTRALLPGLGNVLIHLQYVFLTASLTLRYPGFYQPAASSLNWFSLFSGSGPVTHSRTYSGVADGIYEVNGTYGGTFGLEHMTQIVGAPMTMDLWVNMAIIVGIMCIGLAVIVGAVGFVSRRWKRSSDGDDEIEGMGLRYTAGQVLRAILTYFFLPIVGLSTYQFDHAVIMPAYHIALAAGLLGLMALAFMWLLTQIPMRNLGILILDGSNPYTRLENTTFRRGDSTFVLVLFVLMLIRAVAIGGLQVAPIAQIVVLAVSEVVALVCIAGFQAYRLSSVGVSCTLARLVSILLMTAFLPGVASLETKSLIGYILLLLHGATLVFAFFIPAMYHLAEICVRHAEADRPDAYGLRQLRRREVSHGQDPNSQSSQENGLCPPAPQDGSLRPNHQSYSPSINEQSRFYRPPRSPRPPSYRSTTTLRTSKEPYTGPPHPVHTTEPSISSSESSYDSSAQEEGFQRVPLGPRWDDYSFREADLYYHARAPPRDFGSARHLRESSSATSSSARVWERVTGRSRPETGFQVVRPGARSSSSDKSETG